MADIESLFPFAMRVLELFEKGEVSLGTIAMLKAYASKLGKDAVYFSRDVMGADGLLIQKGPMKHLMDGPTLVTGEGTYEMNVLMAGHDLTGLMAYV